MTELHFLPLIPKVFQSYSVRNLCLDREGLTFLGKRKKMKGTIHNKSTRIFPIVPTFGPSLYRKP